MIKDKLKEQQPIFYRTLRQAFKTDKVPHAFLLCSKKGIDVHQVAMFIARSLLCENDVLACEQCSDCMRVAQDNYPDFIRFDGKEESIKKKHIEKIQEDFAKTSLEGKAKIYLLENIDYATGEAMNSLLKMLEEPVPGIYAILTCENQNRVLPTIQSRSLVIHFRAISEKALAKELQNDGMKTEDAHILAAIYDSAEEIKAIEKDSCYHDLKLEAINFVEDYYTKRDNLLINAQTHVLKNYGKKDEIQFFLDILLVLFKDILYNAYHLDIAFVEHQDLLTSLPCDKEQLMMIIEKILKTKEAIKGNANLMLLMDRFIYEL